MAQLIYMGEQLGGVDQTARTNAQTALTQANTNAADIARAFQNIGSIQATVNSIDKIMILSPSEYENIVQPSSDTLFLLETEASTSDVPGTFQMMYMGHNFALAHITTPTVYKTLVSSGKVQMGVFYIIKNLASNTTFQDIYFNGMRYYSSDLVNMQSQISDMQTSVETAQTNASTALTTATNAQQKADSADTLAHANLGKISQLQQLIPVVSKTQAEYNALSTAEKNNGTLYVVT